MPYTDFKLLQTECASPDVAVRPQRLKQPPPTTNPLASPHSLCFQSFRKAALVL